MERPPDTPGTEEESCAPANSSAFKLIELYLALDLEKQNLFGCSVFVSAQTDTQQQMEEDYIREWWEGCCT